MESTDQKTYEKCYNDVEATESEDSFCDDADPGHYKSFFDKDDESSLDENAHYEMCLCCDSALRNYPKEQVAYLHSEGFDFCDIMGIWYKSGGCIYHGKTVGVVFEDSEEA